MPLLHIVILAVIQGITEFLPVSSSAHLILAHKFLGSEGGEADLTMDIAVHVGTLFAVLVYFRKDLFMIAGKRDWHTVFCLGLASVPAVAAGFALYVIKPDWLRSVELLGWNLILFGVLLWAADRFRPKDATLAQMTWKKALFIGLAQVLSLFPGTSRSGVTMTAGRYLGFNRTEAARFSLMLGIVAISGAGVLGGINLIEAQDAALTYNAALAALISFAAGLGAITFMMRWLAKATFTPFVLYRIVLGIILLMLVYSGGLSP